jgi:hypothetical protein
MVASLVRPAERHPLLRHRLLEVVHAEHAELVADHGGLQVLGELIERFPRLDDAQHGGPPHFSAAMA